MVAPKKLPLITILGDDAQGGSYILRLNIAEPLSLKFGRFKKGKLIDVPAGECLYVGSALGQRGAMSLGRRLVRHATRSGQQAPHPLRAHLLETFAAIGLGSGNLLPKQEKKCFWNVDHLLDQPSVDLSHVIAIRSQVRLEAQLGRLLENDPYTYILEKGLGANDVSGNTHLLGVRADEAWWASLPGRITPLLPAT